MRSSHLRRPPWRRLLRGAVTVFVVSVAIALWPARLGGTTHVVLVRGTSMEPVFSLNDVVVVREKGHYDVGDIVLFRIPSGEAAGQKIIHRLVGHNEDGTWMTQGDNRIHPDQFHLADSDLLGSPLVRLPRAGRLLLLARNTFVVSAVVGLLVLVLLWPRGGGPSVSVPPTGPPDVEPNLAEPWPDPDVVSSSSSV